MSAPRIIRRVALALGALVVLYLLTHLAVVSYAKDAVRDRATALAARYGFDLTIGAVDIPLWAPIALHDVRIAPHGAPPDRPALAAFDHITTDLTLRSALFGARRPSAVTVTGGQIKLHYRDGIPGLTLPPPASPPSSPSSPRALTLTFADVTVAVDAAQTTPRGLLTLEPFLLEDLTATVTRAAEVSFVSALSIDARATFRTAHAHAPVTLHHTPTATSLAATAPLRIGLTLADQSLWLGLSGIERTAEHTLTLRAPNVATPQAQVAAASVSATLHPDLSVTVAGHELTTEVAPLGLSALNIDGITFTLSKKLALPSLHLGGVSIHTPPSSDAPSFTASLASLDLTLADTPLLTLLQHARSNPTAAARALTSLTVTRPDVALTLPSSPDAPDDAPPLPFLGGDDDLPATSPPTPAPAAPPAPSGTLDLVLGLRDLSLPPPLDAAITADLAALVSALAAARPTVADGRLSLSTAPGGSNITLTDVDASLASDPATHNLAARLHARAAGSGGRSGTADLTLTLTPTFELDALEGTLSGRSLAHQLARFVHGLSVPEEAELDLTFRYRRPSTPETPHALTGTLKLAHFSFSFWRISDREIRDLQASVTFDASLDRRSHRLILDLPEIQVGAARFIASIDLRKQLKLRPSFIVKLELPRQDCGAVARSIPRDLIPNLTTLEVAGVADMKASLKLDLNAPRDLVLEVSGDDSACAVRSLAPDIDPARLRQPFVHHPREPGRGVLEHIAVGSATKQWVPSNRIPDVVKLAAWVTEDRRWTEHRGVRFDLIARALKIDLDHGRFIYGGSTITQQLVKNLYLTRGKNLARKLEEAIIAWQMERVLTKDEILTTYINCIEYGPDIYGIKAAAKVYFAKRVEDLDPLEAAFIMGLKPYPKAGYRQFQRGVLDVWWVKRVSHVTKIMAKFDPTILTPEAALAFGEPPWSWQPHFAQTGSALEK